MDDFLFLFLFLLFYLGALQVNLFYVKMDWEVEYKKSVEIKMVEKYRLGISSRSQRMLPYPKPNNPKKLLNNQLFFLRGGKGGEGVKH